MILSRARDVMTDRTAPGRTLCDVVSITAKRAGVSTRTVQRVMAGESVTRNTASHIAKALACRVEDLL